MKMDKKYTYKIEKMSSAVTLSDMEIFIFPDLLIAGALANLMSPVIWEWKRDPWFEDIDKLAPYQRVLKVKQYIIDHYVFNLDLETWGLTTKETEMERFAGIIDFAKVEETNALMGYEGDHYYYDNDIRSHFGLDGYTSNVLPYWKTETVETMTAFRHKPGYRNGAGECVSLSMLYYAALHIVAGIPFDQMYMMATPLHSQNFVALGEGLLTNNRRIVTKSMWNNGTPLSFKARRALANEKVTIIANLDGYVHTMYEDANMPEEQYAAFAAALTGFLRPEINADQFYAFLRQEKQWQRYFYFSAREKKEMRYIAAEDLYTFEAGSNLKLASHSIVKLLRKAGQVLDEPIAGRFAIQTLENKEYQSLTFENREQWPALLGALMPVFSPAEAAELAADFYRFCYIIPRLPEGERRFGSSYGIMVEIEKCTSAQEVVDVLDALRDEVEIADLAFTAFRDLTRSPWCPFLRAALERNPVVVEGMAQMGEEEAYHALLALGNESIYSRHRLAQPDEVFNFRTGDGLEKALCLWDVLWSRDKKKCYSLVITAKEACLRVSGRDYVFPTEKGLPEQVIFYEDAPICAPEHKKEIAALG